MMKLHYLFSAVLLTNFAASGAIAAPIDNICKAGASEPTLVWYSSQDPSRNEAAVTAFKEAYPNIRIESFRLVTGQLATRYSSERAGRIVNADLITLADPVFIQAGISKGWFVKFDKSDMPALAGLEDKWFKNGSATTNISMLGLGYNKNVVGRNPPKSWEDILRPEYKGKIILGDPRVVPSYMALFRILAQKYGDEFFIKLAAQNPIVVPSIVPAAQQLAAGEVAIVFPNVMSTLRPLMVEGAPIDFLAPDMTTGNEFETILSQGADSPNAAKCFYDFLFTKKGAMAYAGPTSVPTIPNLTGTAPMPAGYIAPGIAELGEHSGKIIKLLNLR